MGAIRRRGRRGPPDEDRPENDRCVDRRRIDTERYRRPANLGLYIADPITAAAAADPEAPNGAPILVRAASIVPIVPRIMGGLR